MIAGLIHGLLAMLIVMAQVGLLVAAAPVCAGIRACVAGRLVGGGAVSPAWRWHFIASRLREAATPPSLLPLLGLVAALAAAVLMPAFSLGLLPTGSGDAIVLCGLLVGGRVLLVLTDMGEDGQAASTALPGLLAATVGLPALLLVVALLFTGSETTDLDLAFRGFRGGGTSHGPLVLASLALLLCGIDWNGRSRASTAMIAFGPVRGDAAPGQQAVSMLAGDCLDVLWLTLATDLLMPRALTVMPDVTALTGVSVVGNWLLSCLIACVFWLVRCALGSVLLAAGEVVAFGPVTLVRLRGGVAMLLAVLALQGLAMSPESVSEDGGPAPSGPGVVP